MKNESVGERAREFLAAEYEDAGETWAVWGILNSPIENLRQDLRLSIRAIEEALLLSSGADLEQFREAVMVYRSHLRRTWKYSGSQGHDQATEGDRLLEIIDAASIRHDSRGGLRRDREE